MLLLSFLQILPFRRRFTVLENRDIAAVVELQQGLAFSRSTSIKMY